MTVGDIVIIVGCMTAGQLVGLILFSIFPNILALIRYKRGLPARNDFERNAFEIFKEEIEKEKKKREKT